MACDICGKTGTRLEDLLSIYQTDDIKQICPECGKDVNKQLDKIKKLTSGLTRTFLKRFMKIKRP